MDIETNIQKELQDIAVELTEKLKRIIRDKGLVDTGKLTRSIKVNVTKRSNSIEITIETEDYFKYLDDKYGITKALFTEQLYTDIENRIGRAIETAVQEL
jgi:hypothetical protein